MAIDGVAPRAKMNQQRSRRFRAAKESRDKREDIKRIRTELIERGTVVDSIKLCFTLVIGCQLPPEKSSSFHFDSNCITPVSG